MKAAAYRVVTRTFARHHHPTVKWPCGTGEVAILAEETIAELVLVA